MRGNDWKIPRQIAIIKVVGAGLNAHLCRYSANFFFVLSFRMIILTDSTIGSKFLVRCISQRPSVIFLFPVKINWFFLNILKSNLSNTATHPSSHNFPIDIRDALVRPRNACADHAVADKTFGRGRSPFLWAWISASLGSRALGPFLISPRFSSAFSSRSVT